MVTLLLGELLGTGLEALLRLHFTVIVLPFMMVRVPFPPDHRLRNRSHRHLLWNEFPVIAMAFETYKMTDGEVESAIFPCQLTRFVLLRLQLNPGPF